MELHEQLSLRLAANDLRYVAGSILSAGGGVRSWPFAQWGVMVAYEAMKHLRSVHDVQITVDWDHHMATAARHGGKFFDAKADQLDRVVEDFRTLAHAMHGAFYPEDRLLRILDSSRDDLAVVTDGRELILTNVTGHFMAGFPADLAVDMKNWGPQIQKLSSGIGQLTGSLLEISAAEVLQHGCSSDEHVTWWDGKLADVIPTIFGGELKTEHAMAIIGIHSSVQSARRWARVACCEPCAVAALKHRFVVLHHAARSLLHISNRPEAFGSLAINHVQALLESPDVQTVLAQPARRLRNGWLHLGLGDIASSLGSAAAAHTPVSAYMNIEIADFVHLVDRTLDRVAAEVECWLHQPGPNGTSLFTHLHSPRD